MIPKSLRIALLAGGVLALGLGGLSGCSNKTGGLLFPNERPTVQLTSAPISKDPNNPYFYSYKMDWTGDDPDGRIDHFEYSIDPPHEVVYDTSQCNHGDTCWISTKKNEEIIFFRATHPPDTIVGVQPPLAEDPHVFAIRSVDDKGMRSEVKYRAFYSYTIAPTVQILNPIPSPLLQAKVTPSVRVEWTGDDPDGQFTQKPVKYKYKLFDLNNPDNLIYLAKPDSLRLQEARRNWAGWDSTSADTQFVQFTNLTPGKSYLFVLIGFDEAGAYSPVFSLNSNMLQMACGFASANGPQIHFFNQYIDYTYDSGGYTTDPLREVPIEVPSHVPITVNWEAFPSQGARIQYFRWMVDGNVNDQTPRSDEVNDYIHWSQPSPTMPNAVTLRGFEDGEHRFYLECADNNTQKSLGILKMTAVTPSFDQPLLIIDDTRLEVDKFFQGCPLTYTKPWPARAEFDTFLFARGNVNWRCTKNPTTGVLSPPGLFAGYAFDTLGTRLGLENPANGVLLSKIGKYKNLIWMVDDQGAQYGTNLDQQIFPVTALFSMSAPGRASTLAAYTQLGGRVWLAGGGSAYASLVNFDKRSNNTGQTTVFSSATQFGELVPSRIMYDGAHWQSSIGVTKGSIHTFRNDYTVQVRWADQSVHDTTYVVAPAWSHFDRYSGSTLSSPDYTKLPTEMRWKTAATDPIPPTRLPTAQGLFYQTSYPCEYLLEGNSILEDTDPDPAVTHLQAVLDTLYYAQSIILLTSPPPGGGTQTAPTMTYYHGNEAHQFMFSGFSLWSYARQDCMQLVDFVLQDIWGLPRQPVDRGSIAPLLKKNGGSSPARIVTPAQKVVSARVSSRTTRE